MILDDMKNALETLAADPDAPFSGGVYYGMCTAPTLEEWNYFVFNRAPIHTDSNSRYTETFQVHVVHENYVAEDYVYTVIEALKEAVPGLSLNGDLEYNYTVKGDTQLVVEIATIPFKKARKVNVG